MSTPTECLLALKAWIEARNARRKVWSNLSASEADLFAAETEAIAAETILSAAVDALATIKPTDNLVFWPEGWLPPVFALRDGVYHLVGPAEALRRYWSPA